MNSEAAKRRYRRKGDVDLSPLASDDRNVFLIGDGVGFAFNWHEPGHYDALIAFDPSRKHRFVIDALFVALDWMFARTDCESVKSVLDIEDRDLVFIAKAAPGILECRIAGKAIWSCLARDWLRKSETLEDDGISFHRRLTEELQKFGDTSPIPTDEALNVRAGAFYAMVKAGQIDKAVIWFNRFARLIGLKPMLVLSREPAVIDIGKAIVFFDGPDLNVIQCH